MRVLQPQTAHAVRDMLHLATRQRGTAPKAQAMGYSVGGKTGTAHKQEGKGYAERKYRSFFVGVAPIENPRIVVAVMIDEPAPAATTAATWQGRCSAPRCSRRCACWACSRT